MRDRQHMVMPRGEGNVVSVEFNLLYTWHATLSLQDTEWTTNMIREFFGTENLGSVGLRISNSDLIFIYCVGNAHTIQIQCT